MKLVILPQALAELQQAAAFYIEHANVELGESFAAEFERSISALLEHPPYRQCLARGYTSVSTSPLSIQHRLPDQA